MPTSPAGVCCGGRYEEGPYQLPADRLELLSKQEALLRSCEVAIESLIPFDPSDWGSPNFVDSDQGSALVSVWAAMSYYS